MLESRRAATTLALCHGDLTVIDWASGGVRSPTDAVFGEGNPQCCRPGCVTFAFACSTMFTPDLLQHIARAAVLGLPTGAVVVTLTKPLPLNELVDTKRPDGGKIELFLKLRKETSLRMSWGPAKVFIYVKT